MLMSPIRLLTPHLSLSYARPTPPATLRKDMRPASPTAAAKKRQRTDSMDDFGENGEHLDLTGNTGSPRFMAPEASPARVLLSANRILARFPY